MTPLPLHPLARQSLIASSNPACHGWSVGMTKYLAHDVARNCVQWTLDFVRPYLSDEGENGGVVTRSLEILHQVLDAPRKADLRQMEEFVWVPWNHRSAIFGAGPLARLIWAAMGVAELATPGKAAQLPDAYMFPPETNHLEVAKRLVWDQSASAIQMIAHHHPEVPQVMAQAFTQTVCVSDCPQNCNIESRVEWAWNDVVYEIATLRTPNGFYFEFRDCTVDGSVFSGPFESLNGVNDRMELFKHQPNVIRIVPVEIDER